MQAIVTAQKIDPQLVALLLYLMGDCPPDDADEQIARIVRGAREILDTDLPASAFSDYAERPSTYGVVSGEVERAVATSDESLREPRQRALEMIRSVNHEDGSLFCDDHSLSHFILIAHAEAGLLLGAALMYEMLKGGAR